MLTCSQIGCRDCSGRLSYQGSQDCVFNWSNKYMITWELGFEYAEFVAQAKLTFSQHYQQICNRFKHCAAEDLYMSRGTHRYIADLLHFSNISTVLLTAQQDRFAVGCLDALQLSLSCQNGMTYHLISCKTLSIDSMFDAGPLCRLS